jgi:hypothetical protein
VVFPGRGKHSVSSFQKLDDLLHPWRVSSGSVAEIVRRGLRAEVSRDDAVPFKSAIMVEDHLIWTL